MCLSVVDLTKVSAKTGDVVCRDGIFVGYKAFDREVDEIYEEDEDSEDYGDFIEEIETVHPGLLKKMPKIGQWIKASNEIIEEDSDDAYTSGFHIFTNKLDAENYIPDAAVFKVEFKNICAVGKQSEGDDGVTIIAKEMRLLKRVD